MNDVDPLKIVIEEGLAEANSGKVFFEPLDELETRLKHYGTFGQEIIILQEEDGAYDMSLPDPWDGVKRPPPWFVGLTNDFRKAIRALDKKLQGRILEAIAVLTEDPASIHGDTVKPLTGQFAGCWRYRIGEYRIIYAIDRAMGNVTLLAFSARGSAYVD